MDSITKKCTKCCVEKTLDLFVSNNNVKSGKGSWCKECESKRQKKWYADNPEKVKAKTYRWRNKNMDRFKETLSIWNKNNKDKKRINTNNYTARKTIDGNRISSNEWNELKKKYNHTCLNCKKKEPEIKLTIDHVIPLKVGGKNFIENTQPLCQSCNSSKGIKIIDYR